MNLGKPRLDILANHLHRVLHRRGGIQMLPRIRTQMIPAKNQAARIEGQLARNAIHVVPKHRGSHPGIPASLIHLVRRRLQQQMRIIRERLPHRSFDHPWMRRANRADPAPALGTREETSAKNPTPDHLNRRGSRPQSLCVDSKLFDHPADQPVRAGRIRLQAKFDRSEQPKHLAEDHVHRRPISIGQFVKGSAVQAVIARGIRPSHCDNRAARPALRGPHSTGRHRIAAACRRLKEIP